MLMFNSKVQSCPPMMRFETRTFLLDNCFHTNCHENMVQLFYFPFFQHSTWHITTFRSFMKTSYGLMTLDHDLHSLARLQAARRDYYYKMRRQDYYKTMGLSKESPAPDSSTLPEY